MLGPRNERFAKLYCCKATCDSWTDKVLALKESKEEDVQGASSQGLGDGADDDEWVS